jgi:uncharacterized protein (DUF1330 family)
MNSYFTVAASMAVGMVVGGIAIGGLHAQAKPPVYVVAENDVSNSEAYGKEYAPHMQALIKSHGGRQVAIGGTGGANAKGITPLEGDPPKRAIIQVWDSMEKVQAWRNDPKFKELREIGNKHAKFRSYAVEGLTQ